MATTRTHVILPAEILGEIDALVGKRGRSAFLTEIARREVQKRKLTEFLKSGKIAWKTADHPELKHGSAAWVSKMRREDEQLRLKRKKST